MKKIQFKLINIEWSEKKTATLIHTENHHPSLIYPQKYPEKNYLKTQDQPGLLNDVQN